MSKIAVFDYEDPTPEQLAEFGKRYLEDILSQAKAEEKAGENIEWDFDAKAVLEFIRNNGGTNSTKLHIKNQSEFVIGFCCGEKEYVINPEEEITIEVNDEDCMYLDEVKGAK